MIFKVFKESHPSRALTHFNGISCNIQKKWLVELS
jgi:hypothetical protein